MDEDRTVTEFDEYRLEVGGTVSIVVYGRNFEEAYAKIDELFKDKVLNCDVYRDIWKAERTGHGLGQYREYVFDMYVSVFTTTYDDEMDFDEDEMETKIHDEFVLDELPEYVMDLEIKNLEAVDLEYVDSGYWD